MRKYKVFWNKEGTLFVSFLFLYAIMEILMRYLGGNLYDTIGQSQYKALLILILVGISLQILLSYLKSIVGEWYYSHITSALSLKIENAILFIQQQRLEQFQKGFLLTLFEKDSKNVINFIRRFLDKFVVGLLLFFLSCAVLIKIHILLFFSAIVCMCIPFLFTKMVSKIMGKTYGEYQKANDTLSDMESKGVFNIELLKMSRLEERIVEQHKKQVQQVNDVQKWPACLEALLSAPMLFSTFFTMVVLISVAGYLCILEEISHGDIIVVITLVNYIVSPVMTLDGTISAYKRAQVSFKRIEEICNEESVRSRECTKKDCQTINDIQEIVIKAVSFRYEAGSRIKFYSDIVFRKGMVNLIYGKNGSGKSTLIKLIKKMYDYEGQIYLDKIDLSSISAEEINKIVSVCPQEIFMFSGTILENITMGKDIERSQIKAVCKMIGIHDEIEEMNRGYDTLLQESGLPLSIGQRQRIMIARALLADSYIYVFDEPTSAFDYRRKGNFVRALCDLAKEKIVIVITHDKSLFEEEANIIEVKNEDEKG